jgi:hypothetical protein
MISSQKPQKLGTLKRLKNICQAIFKLECEVSNGSGNIFDYRDYEGLTYFTYWEDEGVAFVIVFDKDKVLIRGVDYQSAMGPGPDVHSIPDIDWIPSLEFWEAPPYPGIIEGIPEEFRGLFLASIKGPGTTVYDGVTFCLWCSNDDNVWRTSLIEYPEHSDSDGSERCLSMLDGSTESCNALRDQLSDYHGVAIADDLLQKFFPLSSTRETMSKIDRALSETNFNEFSNEELLEFIAKQEIAIKLEAAPELYRAWWSSFRMENANSLKGVAKAAEEIALRGKTLEQFIDAWVYSCTDNTQANLFFLDYIDSAGRDYYKLKYKILIYDAVEKISSEIFESSEVATVINNSEFGTLEKREQAESVLRAVRRLDPEYISRFVEILLNIHQASQPPSEKQN